MRRLAGLLAGGDGQRLWPRSRTRLPKQFLSLDGRASFLQRTHARVAGMGADHDAFVLTATETAALVREQLPGLDERHLVSEPLTRDTAATAVLAAQAARALTGGEALLALLPADHAVFDDAAFRAALQAAYAAAEREGCPVLIGVPPTRPEPAYGYILRGPDLPPCGGTALAVVERFVEKPALRRAAEFLADGRHLRNTGVCVCRTDVLLGVLGLYDPGLRALSEGLGGRHPSEVPAAELRALLEPLPARSLDRALLERTERAAVVVAMLAWDDVGSWESLARLQRGDDQGNVRFGDAVFSESERTVVYGASRGRLVVTHGVEDLVVVDTPDATLVAARDALPRLRDALTAVRDGGYGAHLDEAAVREQTRAGAGDPGIELPGAEEVAATTDEAVWEIDLRPHTPAAPALRAQAGPRLLGEDGCRVVAKPWGREVWWAVCPAYAAKRLEVRAGCALSLQYHELKHETLYFLSGQVYLRLGEQERLVGPGDVAVVPPGTVHRMEAVSDAVIFEVSTPELDDVVRLEDRYGRAGVPSGAG